MAITTQLAFQEDRSNICTCPPSDRSLTSGGDPSALCMCVTQLKLPTLLTSPALSPRGDNVLDLVSMRRWYQFLTHFVQIVQGMHVSVPSSIQAPAGSLYTLVRKGGQPPGEASDPGVLQQLGELRAPRLLGKRNSPSKLTATQAVPGNCKSMTHLGAAEGVPCSVIQKVVVATWAHHTSCWTPLHLESAPHRQVFVF